MNNKQKQWKEFIKYKDRNGLKVGDFILNSGELISEVPEIRESFDSYLDKQTQKIIDIIDEEIIKESCKDNGGMTWLALVNLKTKIKEL